MSKHTWLRPSVEPALEPDLPIVDAHHHLWGEGPLAERFGRALPAEDRLANVLLF